MTEQWPEWATVRAEEVRTTLSPDKWGPWALASGGCCKGTPPTWGLDNTLHPAEAPYFFHCLSCIEIERRSSTPKPHPRRDMGLCIKCGQPAERVTKWLRLDIVACRQAETEGTTVAHLGSRKYCAGCDPYTKPFCHGMECNRAVKEGKKRQRASLDCHCRLSDRASRSSPHCMTCCYAYHANSPQRHNRLRLFSAPNAEESGPKTLKSVESGPKTLKSVESGPKTLKSVESGPKTLKSVESGPKTLKSVESGPKTLKSVESGPKTLKSVESGPKTLKSVESGPKTLKSVESGPKTENSEVRGVRAENSEVRGVRAENSEVRGVRAENSEVRGVRAENSEVRGVRAENSEVRGVRAENSHPM